MLVVSDEGRARARAAARAGVRVVRASDIRRLAVEGTVTVDYNRVNLVQRRGSKGRRQMKCGGGGVYREYG